MNDLQLAQASRDSYLLTPTGKVIDWNDMRAVVNDDICAVRGTSNYGNAFRDARVIGEACRTHPQLGNCPSGPLDAAEALVPLVGTPKIVTGHSLGGQCALLVAAILAANGTPPDLVVTFDAPKAGGDDLVKVFLGIKARQYRFRGSVVTDWPIAIYRHVRPLFDVCQFELNAVKAHSIERACDWMKATLGPWD